MNSDVQDLIERIERLEARERALVSAISTTIKITGASADSSLPAFLAGIDAAIRAGRKVNAADETIACLIEISEAARVD